MRAIAAGIAAAVLTTLGFAAPVEAKQPPAKCKVTETRVFEYGAPSGVRVTTVTKCRGVKTVTVVFVVQSGTP